MSDRYNIRCAECGRFISVDDILEDTKTWHTYIPSTEFTEESIGYSHKKCYQEKELK